MNTVPTIAEHRCAGPCPSLDAGPDNAQHANTTAPAEWFGTPMEMVAEAFGMESPWRNRTANWNAHKLNAAKRRARRNELAKASRRRNRRK